MPASTPYPSAAASSPSEAARNVAAGTGARANLRRASVAPESRRPRDDDELGGQRGARRNEPGAKDEREERRRRAVDEGPEAQRLGGDGEGRKARARAVLPEFGPQVHEQHDSDDDGHDPGGHRGRPDAAVEGGPRQDAWVYLDDHDLYMLLIAFVATMIVRSIFFVWWLLTYAFTFRK